MRSYIIEGQSSERQQQYTVEVIHFCNTNLKFHWLFLVTDSSVGKESACNAGDQGSVPVSERSPGEEMVIHSSILAWRIPWTEKPGGATVHGVARVGHNLVTK